MINSLCEIVGSTDTQLMGILKNESNTTWPYKFQEDQEEFSFEISISSDAIVKEIQISAFINYSNSALPSHITIATGKRI